MFQDVDSVRGTAGAKERYAGARYKATYLQDGLQTLARDFIRTLQPGELHRINKAPARTLGNTERITRSGRNEEEHKRIQCICSPRVPQRRGSVRCDYGRDSQIVGIEKERIGNVLYP